MEEDTDCFRDSCFTPWDDSQGVFLFLEVTPMQSRNTFSVKKMVLLAMLAAIAYVMMVFIRIPVVLFLKYEPKDVIITIAGFLFGPFSSFIISFNFLIKCHLIIEALIFIYSTTIYQTASHSPYICCCC